MSEKDVTEHYCLVTECFAENAEGGCLLVVDKIMADYGLGSRHWEQRAKHVHALKRLMMSWAGQSDPVILKEKVRWDPIELQELEERVAMLYTQSFYDHFGRAPIIPHRLSTPYICVQSLVPYRNEPVLHDPRPLIYYELSSFRDLED